MEGLKFLSSKKKSDSPLSNFTLSFHISFSILEGNIEDRLESKGKWGSIFHADNSMLPKSLLVVIINQYVRHKTEFYLLA